MSSNNPEKQEKAREEFTSVLSSVEDLLREVLNLCGVRLCGVTEGPGIHKPQGPHVVDGLEYQVKPREVYVTVDDITDIGGRCATYKFVKTKKGLKLKETVGLKLIGVVRR